jgi:hypothetical protein
MGLKLGRREQFKNLEVEILRGSWSECEPESAKYSFRPSNWSVLALVRFRLLVNMGLKQQRPMFNYVISNSVKRQHSTTNFQPAQCLQIPIKKTLPTGFSLP